MKKTLLIAALLITFSFVSEKEYSVRFNLKDWEGKLQLLEYTKNAIKQSDLPTKVSLNIIDSLSLFQNQIKTQVVSQLDTTKTKK